MSEIHYTKVFTKNILAFNSGVRRIVNKGGTSSSKSISILQLLLEIALDRKETGVIISVISETFPHLRLGVIRDFEIILRNRQFVDGTDYTLANHVYGFGNSLIEFFSADSGKATGPRRDIAYLNECPNIPYQVVEEIEQRTRESIFYDYNPHVQFWMEDKVLSLPETEFVLIKSNYLDNDQLEESIRHEIEMKAARDPNYKRVHVDVEYGISEGLIFPSFEMVDNFPVVSDSLMGTDFGFTNDPSAIIEVAFNDGALYLHQRLYQTGMTNQDIIKFIKTLNIGRKEIIADSAEPKSIREIELAGINIHPCVKGADSIRTGIDLMKTYPIRITKSSLDLIKEFRNYKWKSDKSGNSLNVPIDFFNHGIDASRYAVTNRKLKPKLTAPRSSVV